MFSILIYLKFSYLAQTEKQWKHLGGAHVLVGVCIVNGRGLGLFVTLNKIMLCK